MLVFFSLLCFSTIAACMRAIRIPIPAEEATKEPGVVGGIRIPHRECCVHFRQAHPPDAYVDKRQIIEGPGGYAFNVLQHLAGIAPYFDSPGVQIDPSVPDGCSVDKATYFVRHSNIYANDVSSFSHFFYLRVSAQKCVV